MFSITQSNYQKIIPKDLDTSLKQNMENNKFLNNYTKYKRKMYVIL